MPFPDNLKMITSNVRWYCGTDDTTAGSKDPPKICKSGMLGVRITFPDCYNGLDDPIDHRAHMARSVLQSNGTRLCPDTHPILVPTLVLNANFPIPRTSGRVTLSSGAASTMHADFWNTWDQTELERLVVECINNGSPSDPHPGSVELQPGLPRIRATFGVTGSGYARSRFLFTNFPESAFSEVRLQDPAWPRSYSYASLAR